MLQNKMIPFLIRFNLKPFNLKSFRNLKLSDLKRAKFLTAMLKIIDDIFSVQKYTLLTHLFKKRKGKTKKKGKNFLKGKKCSLVSNKVTKSAKIMLAHA